MSCSAGNLGHFDVPLPELGAEGGGGALGVRHVEVQRDLVCILRADLDIHYTGELSPHSIDPFVPTYCGARCWCDR